jgi:predicted DNA-binding protein with PD1-like motif
MASNRSIVSGTATSSSRREGDEAFSGLLEFAEKYQVTSAHFTAIGALIAGEADSDDDHINLF